MTWPKICLLCNAPSKSTPIQRGGLLIHSCANCGLKYGETGGASATLKTGSVDTDPHHFSTLLARYEALEVALTALVEKRMAAFTGRLGETPRHWLEIGPGSGLLSAIVERMGGAKLARLRDRRGDGHRDGGAGTRRRAR